MAIIPNNSASSTVTSSGAVAFTDGVIISTVPASGFLTFLYTDWIRIAGFPKLTLHCKATDNGNAPAAPDSTVSQVVVSLEIGLLNGEQFEAGAGINALRVGQFTVPMTTVDTTTFDVPQLYQEFYSVGAKFCRVKVEFMPQDVIVNTSTAKLYVSLMASC